MAPRGSRTAVPLHLTGQQATIESSETRGSLSVLLLAVTTRPHLHTAWQSRSVNSAAFKTQLPAVSTRPIVHCDSF